MASKEGGPHRPGRLILSPIFHQPISGVPPGPSVLKVLKTREV